MASVVGVRFGRRRWPGTSKTLEGSAAAAGSMLACFWVLLALEGAPLPLRGATLGLGLCTLVACALEAVTTQIDNLFLPLVLAVWLMLAAAWELGA